MTEETGPAMHSRRSILALGAALALTASGAFALDAPGQQPPARFDAKAFDAAKASGKPVLVEISAPWCPICKAQRPIIARLRAEPRFKDLVAFEIDFDTDKPSVRHVGAQLQSTLLVYKDGKEVGRSVGEAQPEWIEDLLERAL